jgi:hypothetical protein
MSGIGSRRAVKLPARIGPLYEANDIGVAAFYLLLVIFVGLVAFDLIGVYGGDWEQGTTVHTIALIIMIGLYVLFRLNGRKLSSK